MPKENNIVKTNERRTKLVAASRGAAKKMCPRERITIGWLSCNTSERISLVGCYKCRIFGHTSRHVQEKAGRMTADILSDQKTACSMKDWEILMEGSLIEQRYIYFSRTGSKIWASPHSSAVDWEVFNISIKWNIETMEKKPAAERAESSNNWAQE
ncbi:hypothetical protein JTB14_019331 [Gonioctena quinquepunctata]|nr:hypothetical protein JTB14_019331 [Gonioctena quinquepunctata]